MRRVPLNDLSRALRAQQDDLAAATARVLASGWLVHGPEHAAFETELAQHVGVRHALGVASGTDALVIALRALSADPARDRVLTAANCGGYTSVAARAAGLRVGYVDVDPESHLVDPEAVARALTPDVAVVVVTHLYGRAADVGAVRAVCEPRGVRVLEDRAQSIGARRPEGAAGSLGHAATFSFYPTKNLGALGDGGAVATDDDALADRVRAARQYGWGAKYAIEHPFGRNSRLDELQAAVLRTRLPLLAAGNARRREIVGRYARAASARVRVLPAEGAGHVGHLAVVETGSRDELRAHLEAHGVGTDVHYPTPDHRQPAFAAEYADVTLPVTERLAGSILSVPCFPELTDPEIEQVSAALASF